MRSQSKLGVLVLVPLAIACSRGVEVASEPSPSASFDPVGTYDFTATLPNETRTGTIVVTREGDTLGGHATLDGEVEPAHIDSGYVAGNRMVLEVMAPGESFTFDLTFTGASFTGVARAANFEIPLTGSKRAP